MCESPAETELYYLKSRYYDPKICRFINADGLASTGQGFLGCNMFAYCLNNPVNMSDQSGTLPNWVTKALGIVAGVAAGVLVGVAVVAMAPEVLCAATLSLSLYGVGYGAAEVLALLGVSFFAANTTMYAMDAAYSMATGSSPVEESLGNNHNTYEAWRFTSAMLIYGYGYMAESGARMGVCFAEGTLIQTKNGEVPIEEIRIGDLVWAWNEDTGAVELKPVAETYINECAELVHLTVLGETITCTLNHPFYVPQKGWTAAAQLRAGDILVLLNGDYVVLEKVQHELLEAPIHVFNFQVEGFHTYYVGTNGLLVHNSCGNNNGPNGRIINISKQQSPVWNRLPNYRNGLKYSGTGSKRLYYSWDYLHNEIEVYNRRGEHIGVLDPLTGEWIKQFVKGRDINV